MGTIIWYIYSRPLPQLIALVLVGMILWRRFREPLWRRAGRPRLWWWVCLLLFLFWLFAALYATIIDRSEGTGEMILTPFWSYWEAFRPGGNPEMLRANLMNVLLFLPGGLLLGELLPRRWSWQKALLAFAFSLSLSVGIETAQALFELGLAETDDVIHNSLGGLLGSLPAALPCRFLEKVEEE